MTSAVATPTCSSCCCCCCCLAAVANASMLAAERVNEEGRRNEVPHRELYVALAALFFPLSVVLGVVAYQVSDGLNGLVVGVVASIVILWAAYRGVRTADLATKLSGLYVLFVVTLVVEFVAGGFLVLTGAGALYLVLALTAVTFVIVAMVRRMSQGEQAVLTESHQRPTDYWVGDGDGPGAPELPELPAQQATPDAPPEPPDLPEPPKAPEPPKTP